MITVAAATEADDELVAALARLLPQLTQTRRPPSREELAELLARDTVLVARDGETIVGTLTLVVYRIPTGLRARIEDVVVDEQARGQGVGEQLTRAAIDLARRRGAVTVELTSHPSREAANRLYRRLGFEHRETNTYRIEP